MDIKSVSSENYNMKFDKETGVMMRWGKTVNDDPDMSTFGPEILDIEISAGGSCLGNCPFCYKCNGGGGPTHNMTLSQFKTIISKFNLDSLTQMALGIMDITTNPDFFNMMSYAKDIGVIPNYTTHGLDMTPRFARLSRELCGVVSVSLVNKEFTYNAIKLLEDAGMRQMNIHYMLSEESFDGALSLLDDVAEDDRLRKLHAVVFLQYKSKGRGIGNYTTMRSVDKYQQLLEKARHLRIPVGFDSCSAPMYLKVLESDVDGPLLSIFAEPCESGLFSSYINCHGEFFPCSFMEGQVGWEKGINVLECSDFNKDVWESERLNGWRDRLLKKDPKCSSCKLQSSCRVCPEYTDLRCL